MRKTLSITLESRKNQIDKKPQPSFSMFVTPKILARKISHRLHSISKLHILLPKALTFLLFSSHSLVHIQDSQTDLSQQKVI